MILNDLNALTNEQGYQLFESCCAAPKWVFAMLEERPYIDLAQVLSVSESAWARCEKTDYLAAFEAHPKIGDISSLKKKYANTAVLAGSEQSSVGVASDEVISELAIHNALYIERFGFIFIVFATGKSALDMLTLLKQRLSNDPEIELKIAAGEQLKITQLRLKNILSTVS